MSVIGWIIVVLVTAVVIYKVFFSGKSNAIGYTQEHGYCPNMGVCNGCDVCEGD